MAFHVRDAEADTMVREFARERGVGLTDAVKLAVTEANRARVKTVEEKRRAIQEIVDEIALLPRTGETADKAFFDSLNDEDDD